MSFRNRRIFGLEMVAAEFAGEHRYSELATYYATTDTDMFKQNMSYEETPLKHRVFLKCDDEGGIVDRWVVRYKLLKNPLYPKNPPRLLLIIHRVETLVILEGVNVMRLYNFLEKDNPIFIR